MVVGVLRVGLALPGNDSLKGKRSVVRKILDRARSRFNAAAAEVGGLDAHTRAELAFAVVSNDHRHANEMLDHIAAFVAGASEALVVTRRTELVPLGTRLTLDDRDVWIGGGDDDGRHGGPDSDEEGT